MKRACWLWLSLLAFDAHAADSYRLDADHTRVSFGVRRFGIPWIDAGFSRFDGDLVVDRKGADSRIVVTVRTDSLEGLDFGWNSRLRSPEWLDTARYPEMSYRSSRIEFDAADGAVAEGELTLHGITRTVRFDIRHIDCAAEDSAASACGFSAHATIQRSDFGLPHGFWLAGDQVEISVQGSAVRSGPHLASAGGAAHTGN